MTTAAHTGVPGIEHLIREAQEHPPRPVIDGLLNEHEIVGLHGPPEVFKTTLLLQLAEGLATGNRFLGIWPVPRPQRVYFFETEMSVAAIGKRLSKMFAGRVIPTLVGFADEQRLRQFKRKPDLGKKFDLLRTWVAEHESEVVILDTCNPFFRGNQSPNDETTVGAFFDRLEALPAAIKLFARHNHKPRMEDSGDGVARIRGSGQFADVPDLLLELSRTDKRTNEAVLEVTKFRHGTKPDPLTLWFDTAGLRLISIPPVIRLLRDGPLSRTELLDGLQKRFGIGQRKGDDLIDDQRPFLREHQMGHSHVLEINSEAARSAEWFARLSGESGTDRDMQDCISSSVSPEQPQV